jgi:hypothetical protein
VGLSLLLRMQNLKELKDTLNAPLNTNVSYLTKRNIHLQADLLVEPRYGIQKLSIQYPNFKGISYI